MTSVLSLTVATSGGLSKVSSFYMLLDEALTSKKLTVDILTAFGSFDRALMTRTTTLNWGVSNPTGWIADSVQYDTNSFTDASTLGVLRIQNDKYSQVMVGGSFHANNGTYGGAELWKNGSPVGMPVDNCDYISDSDPSDNYVPVLCSAPMFVSSGDYFNMRFRQSTTGRRSFPWATACLWIIGVARR